MVRLGQGQQLKIIEMKSKRLDSDVSGHQPDRAHHRLIYKLSCLRQRRWAL